MPLDEDLRELIALLNTGMPAAPLSGERQHALLLRGAVAELEEISSQEAGKDETARAIDALRVAAGVNPIPAVRGQALQALLRLAQEGQALAVDSLYRLSVEEDSLAARQAILTRGWKPQHPTLRALFDWFTHLAEGKPFPEEALPLLTDAYFSDATPAVQRRLSSTAAQNHAGHWASIVTAVQNGGPALEELVRRYPAFRPVERIVALNLLEGMAARGAPGAAEALASLFIQHEDLRAKEILFSTGVMPEDPMQRAMAFFLAGDWARYNSLDFDHRLLIAAYEQAGRSLRRRLLEHSRYTGQTGWLRELESAGISVGTGEVRWLNDLTDADWELAIRRLSESSRLNDLWRLAQAAPPIWSAAILTRLAGQGWAPEEPEEREAFTRLAADAARCMEDPLSLRPRKKLYTSSDQITSLAVHPEGKRLAAGSGDASVSIWKLPDGKLREPPLMGPTAVTRALAFSPDGELLACAGGDNRIRIFRASTGQIVKTLEGHRAMVRGLAIHPDGRSLYSAGFDGTVHFWRFPHGALLKTLRPGPGEIFSMALGLNGSHLLTAGADSLIHVWSLPDGGLSRELVGHTSTITLLASSGASELTASAGRDGMLRLWNFISGGIVRSIPLQVPLTALCMHSNDQVLIGGSGSGEIFLWNLSTGRVLETLKGHDKPITALALSPEGDRLYSADSGVPGVSAAVNAWDLRTFFDIRLPGESTRPGAVNTMLERARGANISAAEKRWLEFSAALAGWRQRFDIELVELETIPVGEFDIEIT